MIRSYFNFRDQKRSIRQKEKKNWLKWIKTESFSYIFLFFLNIDVNLQNVFYTGFKRNKT